MQLRLPRLSIPICRVGESQVSLPVSPPLAHLQWRYFAHFEKNSFLFLFLFLLFLFCGWCLHLVVDVWWVVLGMNMLLFGGTCGLLDVSLGACGCVVGEFMACWMCCWGLVDVLLGTCGCVVGGK